MNQTNGEDPRDNNGAEPAVERRQRPASKRNWLRLPRYSRKSRPGAVPGIELHELERMPSTEEPVFVSCIDYSKEEVQAQWVTDIDEFVARHRPEWSAVRWINVDGLNSMKVIRALAQKYHLHPLAVEDLIHVPHRPKVEAYQAAGDYQARLFIIVKMFELKSGRLQSDQISIFLGHKTVLTFQETRGDVWDNIRQRINTPLSRLRLNDASFLVHSLIDAIVDHCFPILEYYGDRLEAVEERLLTTPARELIQEIHVLKRELLLLRRALWPMREAISVLQREPHECLSDTTRVYMRDVYDHTVQIIDILETYREVASGLSEAYMTAVSNRMSEVMKVLTLIGTIFIPLTFLAGVYGMNFHFFPELSWRWAYGAFWLVCIATAVVMVWWFRRRGWLDSSEGRSGRRRHRRHPESHSER